MASTKGYLDYLKEQLSGMEGVSWRAMMGEYLLYVRGRLVGGVYDDRLLVKPTPAAQALLPAAARERPYPGAKEMLLVEDVDDAEALTSLLTTLAEALPPPPP